MRTKKPERGRSSPEELLAELAGVYREADALYAGWSCPASTECCRFGVTGREPYVTSIEVLAVERATKAGGGPLSPRRRALPMTTDSVRERVCAFLDASGRCAVYANRPFGCRTYFCERAIPGGKRSRPEEKRLVDRVRDIAARHEPGGDAPRSLSRVFPTKA
jgi:Fe-S-cluster containining protein